MKSYFIGITTLFLLVWGQQARAQSVGINTGSPDPTAVLDVYSENRGILIPRVTSNSRLGIINPALSLLVFDIDSAAFFFYDGSRWKSLAQGDTGDNWVQGNGYLYNDESLIGIGTDTVLALLHLHSDTTSPYMLISTDYYHSIIGLDETDGTIFIGRDINGNPIKQLVLDTAGHVGIGTTRPEELLHLAADSNVAIKMETSNYNVIIGLDETDGTIIVGRDSSGTVKDQLVIDTAGRVGIGTRTPAEALHLAVDTGDAAIRMETPLHNVIIGLDETDGTISIGRDSSGVAATHIEIDTAGRVGVGSLDNTAQLNVDGRVKTNELELHSSNGNYVIALDDQGMPDLSKSSNNYLDLYDATVSFGNAFVDIRWSQQRWAPPAGSAYSHDRTAVNNDEITIVREGLYKITYNLSYEGTVLLDAEIETVLQHKPGSGTFSPVGGSTTYSSVGLNLSSNRSSVTKTIIMPLSQGDIIKLQAKRSAGSGAVNTLPDGCSITIERL